MLDVAFEITWERPKQSGGFVWRETDTGETQLVRIAGVPFETYEPLKEKEFTGLFRTFANLSTNPASMLDFANRYGALGDSWDDFALWKEGIARMKALVGVWDALTDQDWTSLRAILSRLPKALFQPSKADARTANVNELVTAGVHLLYHEVGGRIFGWTFGVWSRQQKSPVIWHPQSKRVILKFVPPSLMDAMLLQLVQAVLGNKNYQQCEACGRWFELAPRRAFRADRKTCSDSCRVKLSRVRQRVRELRAQKWSFKQISKELCTNISTIKKWLSKNKE